MRRNNNSNVHSSLLDLRFLLWKMTFSDEGSLDIIKECVLEVLDKHRLE